MQINLHYTYDGKPPEQRGLYFCIYIDPTGKPSFGLARVEFDIPTEQWRWNPELSKPFGDSPPLCYMELSGNITDIIVALQHMKTVELTMDHIHKQ